MGTPANHELLAAAGLATAETKGAASGDLVIPLLAETESAGRAGLAEAERVLHEQRSALAPAGAALPAHARLGAPPDARREPGGDLGPRRVRDVRGQRALRRGLHVFLQRQRLARRRDRAEAAGRRARLALAWGRIAAPRTCQRLVSGSPTWWTAARRLRRRLGHGLQAVVSGWLPWARACRTALGGGRDLSAEVGGVMTMIALDALAADSATEAIVVIGKASGRRGRASAESAIARVAKPVVVCCLGARPKGAGAGTWAGDARRRCGAGGRDAARSSVAPVCSPIPPRASPARARAIELGAGANPRLTPEERSPTSRPRAGASRRCRCTASRSRDDELTRGRPHPMLDPEARSARVREIVESPDVSVAVARPRARSARLPTPPPRWRLPSVRRGAPPLRPGVSSLSWPRSSHRRRSPGFPPSDRDAGGGRVEVLPSNAQASRFAALVIRPIWNTRC